MLQTRYTAAGWLLLLIVFITSCTSSTPKQTKYIPKDASVVFSINPKKLNDKLTDSKISLDSLMRSAFSEDTSMALTSADIASSGIDVTKDIFLFVNQSGSIMSGSTVSTGVVAVLDKASDFEAFLKKKSPGAEIKKEKDFSYATVKGFSAIGWTDDIVIMSNVSGYNTQTGEQTGTAEAAHQQLVTFFSQKEEASLASVKQFKDANDGKADMFFWSNSNGALASIPMVGMSKASDLFKDTYTAGAINFNNGEVDMDMKSYPNDAFKDTLKKYAGPKVNMDLLNKYPGAVTGFALFSFDPKLIVSILNFAGLAQTADQFLGNLGITLGDVTNAFKGDFAVVFSNVGMEQKTFPGMTQTYASPSAKLVIDAAIGDKAAYDKIVAALAKKGLMVQKGGQFVPGFMAEDSTLSMYSDARNIVISSDASLMQQYVAGSGKVTLPSGVSDKAKGNAVVFYVDIATILNAMPADSSATSITASAKQTFKDVIATSDNFSNGSISGHAELHTTNNKENSLATLARYFGSLSETMKRMKSEAGMNEMPMEQPDTSTMMQAPADSAIQ